MNHKQYCPEYDLVLVRAPVESSKGTFDAREQAQYGRPQYLDSDLTKQRTMIDCWKSTLRESTKNLQRAPQRWALQIPLQDWNLAFGTLQRASTCNSKPTAYYPC